MSQPGTIFISYRRSDSHAEAGRIYDKLVGVFGPDRIFKDVDNIPYGADFVEYLDQAVAQCDVLMVLIGHTWLTVTDAQDKRRLDDPHDFVQIEIASALKRDILVVPVLLNGVLMPTPENLPEDLRPLTRRNAVQVRQDPDFHRDMQRLITNLEDSFASRGVAATDNDQIARQSKGKSSNSASQLDGMAKLTSLSLLSSIRYVAAGIVIIMLLGIILIFQMLLEPGPDPPPPPKPDSSPPSEPDSSPPPEQDSREPRPQTQPAPRQ